MGDFVIENGVLKEYGGPGGDVVIPDGVTSIGLEAFHYCSSLTSVTIPESVTSIGDSAFSGCTSLTSVTIPESVTSIGDRAFKYCCSLTSIVIPSRLKRIGRDLLCGCSNLTSVTIPEGVTSIGAGAFSCCRNLTSVTIPKSVTNIGDGAFSCCNKLADGNGFVIVEHILFDYCGPGGGVAIPVGVSRISVNAFSGYSVLVKVTIPEGVTSICDEAFQDCSSLTSVTIPESVTSIGHAAFYGCNKLKHVSIPDSISMDVLTKARLYAALDEASMTDLITQAKKWDKNERNEFFRSYLLSDTRAAMLLAEKRKELDKYAAMRGVDADEIRDKYLSDLGLDMHGRKSYDLGNMSVGIRMNPDFSFTVELPDGKISKSLPKKGADPEKYDAANKDFAQVKKDSKKIWKNRADLLLADFITGKERTAEYWKKAYGGNPILHAMACLLVWEQGGKTFRRTDDGLITADGSAYELTDEPVRVAHPIETEAAELEAWRKHFTSRGLKQPFAQIWERAYDPGEIAPNRYAGCPIIFFQLQGAEKHGFNQHLNIPGCKVEAKWSTETAANGNKVSYCDIQSFTIEKYSRAVNHALAYLDRVTITGRIAKDDTDVMRSVEGSNVAQVTEYIGVAQENAAVNVLALLLKYKNTHFSDFDPMDEFTLE